MTFMGQFTRLTVPISVVLMLVGAPVYGDQRPYTVTNETQVDGETFRGFQIFRNWCARCHGTYGQGLAAPNLAVSLNQMTKADFMRVIGENKITAHGSPGWSANTQVMAHREQIYRYLKARADGAIGVLTPELAQ